MKSQNEFMCVCVCVSEIVNVLIVACEFIATGDYFCELI